MGQQLNTATKAELEVASSNSIALSLQQINDIRQTLVTTLVKSSALRGQWFKVRVHHLKLMALG